MKKGILLIIGVLVAVAVLSAQNTTESQGSKDGVKIQTEYGDFIEPELDNRFDSDLFRFLRSFAHQKNSKLEMVKDIRYYPDMSVFQYIINPEGNIIDGKIVESMNPGKDTKILNKIFSMKLFSTSPYLNGEKCYAVVMFRVGFNQSGFYYNFQYYPLVGMPDTADTTE